MYQIKSFFLRIIVAFFIIWLGHLTQLQAQSTANVQDYQSLSSFMSLNQQIQKTQSLTGQDLVISVDETEYEVDSGDEFYIRIDVEGPNVKAFHSTVSADGLLFFPEAPAIKVRGLILEKARDKILKHLKKFYNGNEIDVSLAKVHHVRVSVIGALQPLVDLKLTSADHLIDAVQKTVIAYKTDTLRAKLLDRVSMRRIDIIRDDSREEYDLLRFLHMGDEKQNPLLKTNDIIFVNFRDTLLGNIKIHGQVGKPGIYEYLPGDDFSTIISLAGGLLSAADSNRIEVYRPSDLASYHSLVSYKDSGRFLLQAGDQIFVRPKTVYKDQKYIQIKGNVKYPGLYPVIEGVTKVSDVLQWCGGFTDEADIQVAYLERKMKMLQKPGEIERILESSNTNTRLSTSEYSYLKEFHRTKLDVVQIQFDEILKNPHTVNNIFLKDKDILRIPSKTQTVIIYGGVKKPGVYPYIKNFTIKDYVQFAGGYSSREKISMMKIIKGKNGAWLDADEDTIPIQGDQIFIPRRSEWEFWPMFKETLALLGQVATVYFIIVSAKKM